MGCPPFGVMAPWYGAAGLTTALRNDAVIRFAIKGPPPSGEGRSSTLTPEPSVSWPAWPQANQRSPPPGGHLNLPLRSCLAVIYIASFFAVNAVGESLNPVASHPPRG